MNSEEQTLIDGLFSRLQQAEKDSAPRDAQAEARIKEHLASQPAAGYFMAQAILVQEAAIKRLDEQNRQLAQQVEQLQAELQQARSQASAPAGGGGFLSSIFGGSNRDARPASPPPSSGGGWREPPRSSFNAPAQQGFSAPPGNYGAAPQQAPAASSFLGGALKTAAGVAGGVMLAQGISSLFHSGQQPQEIVEVIKEEPAQPVNDTGDNGWGDDQRVADNQAYGNDSDGFSDADYSDDGSFFGDDDSFV
ncbi:ABC transporter substrate-binding protein [Pseudomonas chlororaphis]|uniref:ABC transporter substrate-binding protein n=1 Tax=Pseudomonas chlororaphis TaxID=587753 RepID=A0A0G3GGX4_9PSED|nr:ABC transporter substrate-binding protein [Pseudomonas chlororaphis]